MVPSHIDLDIEHMQVGDAIHVSDLQVSEKVHILTDPAAAVVNIMAPAVIKDDEQEDQAAVVTAEAPKTKE